MKIEETACKHCGRMIYKSALQGEWQHYPQPECGKPEPDTGWIVRVYDFPPSEFLIPPKDKQ